MSANALTCYVCQAQQERLALPAESVSEILRSPRISPWPNSPAALAGLTSLRGRPIPVFSLRPWLPRPASPGDDEGRFVVLVGRDAEQAGLVVDTLPQPLPGAVGTDPPAQQRLDAALASFLSYSVTTTEGCFHVLDYPALFRALGQGQAPARSA